MTLKGWVGMDGNPSLHVMKSPPSFSVQKNHENNRKVALVIKHDSRENLYGGWSKTFEVEGGMHYRGRLLLGPRM